MSLKPFQIRDLHGDSSLNAQEASSKSSGAPATVQISSSEYDDLAGNHPRARLTYLDDDDGDQITVGSSLELSQRLDEPPEVKYSLPPVHSPESDTTSMHIFDIRRSNSVTELWKRYEIQTSESSQAADKDDASFAVPATAATSGPVDDQPLLAAFEAELANMLHHTEDPPEAQPEQPDAERSTADERRTPHPAEILASQILHNLVHGATLVQSELRSRWPELQRQLREAQRSVPENVIPSLQSILATIEAHMRTAFNNIPDGGRQWAENTYQAGRPMAENATDNFRTVASELNEIGRTLFAAFENEFGRLNPSNVNTATGTANPASTYYPEAATDGVTTPHSIYGIEHQGHNKDAKELKTEAPDAHRPTASNPTDSNSAPACHSSCQNPPAYPYINPTPMPHPPHLGPFPHFVRPWPMPQFAPPFKGRPLEPLDPGPSPIYQGSFMATNGPSSSPFGNTQYHDPQPVRLVDGPRHCYTNKSPSPTFFPHGNQPSMWPSAYSTGAGSDNRMTSQYPGETRPENKTLFIGNIGFHVTEEVIKNVFASRGFIVTVNLPTDAVSGKHAGFGYLRFPSFHAAMAALQALQGTHIDGHAINLEFSHATPTSGNDHTEAGPQAQDSNSSQSQSVHDTSKVSEPKSSEAMSKKTTPMKRRKSVTFREPARLDGDPTIAPSETSKTEPDLIDLTSSSNEVTSTAAPLPRPFTIGGLDDLPHLNPEAQMSRFPPVSQFEAQVVANHQQRRSSGAGSDLPSIQGGNTLPTDAQNIVIGNSLAPLQANNHPRRSQTTTLPLRPRDSDGTDLRRANTMTSPNRSSGETFTRRGSESVPAPENTPRHGHRMGKRVLNPGISSEHDTWARLDKRERSRSRPRSMQSIPGSFPSDEQPDPTAIAPSGKEDGIESCVNSLVDMGYGTAEEGGRPRMAVYAAASNGVLLDAIEMIEDERKAYARSPYL